jgi:hypothetical protein
LKGLFLFAPVLKIKTHLTPFIPVVYWISKFIDRLQWWDIEADLGTARYESIPINSVYQTQALINIVQRKLARQHLSLPIFVEETAVDETVDVHALLTFFRANNNPASVLLWYYEGGTYPLLHDERIQPINSPIPKERILSLSHLSLTLPANDPIYGKNGQYKDCLEYTIDSNDWLECRSDTSIYYLGELTEKDLKTHLIRRITFNPYYNYMTSRMTMFLSPLTVKPD